ncbi:hypothetical protein MauCBS54593_000281 [Microsporum audouinii]
MENGDLRSYIAKNRPSSLLQLSWFREAARTLSRIHDRRVIVADISSRNFLLDSDLSVKICGFTESSILPLSANMETVDDNGYSIQTDIGQLGAVMYEVITGERCEFDFFGGEALDGRATWPRRETLPSTQNVWLGSIIMRCWTEGGFRNAHCLSEALESASLERSVSKMESAEFDSLYPDRGPRISTNLHDRVLVLEVTVGKVHEVAALALEAYLIAETTNMNLDYTTICSGAGRATSDVFAKEPDGSFTLKHRDWPILTIEAGVSESDAKLNMDARGWLESPESETEVVITIKVNRHFPQMTFNKWEKSTTLQHRATRSSHQPAEATQTVHVRYSNDITEVTGNMVIPLAKLAGRGPQNTNEHDIIITEAAFEMISKKVWIAQEFL